MRINVFALLAAAVMISALFLPWVSTGFAGIGQSSSGRQLEAIVAFFSSKFSPFQDVVGFSFINATTNSVIARAESTVAPQIIFLSLQDVTPSWFLAWTPIQVYLFFNFLYLFAVGLMTLASFANDSWSKVGRRTSIAASNLLFVTIFIYILFFFYFVTARAPAPPHSFMYLDVGFWIAIFGAALAFVSWLHPKLITINIKLKTETFNRVKHWLPAGEWEKAAVMAVAAFLAVFIFAIIYLPLL